MDRERNGQKYKKHKKTWIVETYKYCFPILEGHLILRPTTNEDISGIWNFKKLITKLLSVGNSEQTINKFSRNGSIPSSQSALRYSETWPPHPPKAFGLLPQRQRSVFGVQVVNFFCWVVKRGCVMRMTKCYPKDEAMQNFPNFRGVICPLNSVWYATLCYWGSDLEPGMMYSPIEKRS